MRVGIDFGTTRIVAAMVDRGNYPIVVFDAPDGSAREWFPPLVAVERDRRLYGWEAWAAQEEPGWTVVRSLKRALESSGPETRLQIGGEAFPVLQILTEMVMALRSNLIERSSLPASKGEPLEVMLGVPANANSNQRFLTVEAFRQGGLQVLGLLNEPSAASIEYSHLKGARKKSEKVRTLVYDLGGGTFDASLVEADEREHAVIASEGIAALGGDDFDEILAELALEAAGVTEQERDSLTQGELFRLDEECRQKKESLHPNTRRMTIDLGVVRPGWQQVSVLVNDFYDRCCPLIEKTLHLTEALLAESAPAPTGAAADGKEEGSQPDVLYVTGGGSELPLVARVLRETFGRRVRRSAYTRSATAIGLAIQADAQSGYRLQDRFTRHFGVWRETQGGAAVIFDPLFPKGIKLPRPADPPLTTARRYIPVHNIGHFRYLECSRVTDEGRPAGDSAVWDEIRFPFDTSLENNKQLTEVPVIRQNGGSSAEAAESYSCDANGLVTVTITRFSDGYSRRYQLSRWSAAERAVTPGRRRKGPSRR